MKNKIFITGANGFVGRKVCFELDRLGIDYLAMVQPGKETPLNKDKTVESSLQDKENLKKIMHEYQPDAILHLAAIANPTYGEITKLYEVNVTGSENLLEAVKNTGKTDTRVILVSTAGVYGNQDAEYLQEGLPFNPANHYSYSKMVMEYLSKNYTDEMDICIVRPFNMIGAGQQENFLIPKLVKNYVLKEEKIKLGNMDSARDYVDVDYAVQVFIELLTRETVNEPVLNICTGKATKGTEVLQMLEELTGHKPEIEITSEFVRKNEVWRMIGDPARLNTFMGDGRKFKELREMLQEMVLYYQEKK